MRFKKPKPLSNKLLNAGRSYAARPVGASKRTTPTLTLSNVAITGVDNSPQMSGSLPAHCSNCGTLFGASGAIRGAPGTRIVLEGVSTDCPNCGQMASFLDGTFEIAENAFSLLSGPSFTKRILESFAELVDRAADKQISPDELAKQSGDLDSELGEVVKNLLRGHPVAGVAALIILVLWLRTCHFNMDVKFDVNEFWNQAVAARHGLIYAPPVTDGNTSKSEPRSGTKESNPSRISSQPKPLNK
jgi:hypothetical protein